MTTSEQSYSAKYSAAAAEMHERFGAVNGVREGFVGGERGGVLP